MAAARPPSPSVIYFGGDVGMDASVAREKVEAIEHPRRGSVLTWINREIFEAAGVTNLPPLPRGERVGVRGLGRLRKIRASEPPHPRFANARSTPLPSGER